MTSYYNHKTSESKWQDIWYKDKLYAADDKLPKKYYLLVELTYTSGDLHIGHWFSWTAPDVHARFKRMQGYNVLFPVGGYDSFGLPAENAAIKHGVKPRDWTQKNIDAMRLQFRKLGPSFDWEKEVVTSDPDYYRWTQWLFLRLYKEGLAYRGKVWSNWCPECKTVLANEHVENGCCWRHSSTPVEQRLVDQWLIKITDYADRLIWKKTEGPERSPRIDWPKAHKDAQNNWIGKSVGVEIDWKVDGRKDSIKTFTTRLDTIFGATFLVLSPEHPLALKITTDESKQKVSEYIKDSNKKLERERLEDVKEKTGIFTGAFAINPFSKSKVPIWVGDFVLMGYGTGAIMAVPGHDVRDWEFAKKHNLPIVTVIKPTSGRFALQGKDLGVFTGDGVLVNSPEGWTKFDGISSEEARVKMSKYIEEHKLGKASVQYHLRDWSISRRRYWGAPVPIIYCETCFKNTSEKKLKELKEGVDWADIDGKKYMIHPVPEKDLPVTLPENVDYLPTGMAPLATAPGWMKVSCPVCGGPAQREAETLDTYIDSSWYFLRYPTPKYTKGPFDESSLKEWMPIQVYFGGPEHILGHTLYARFVTKFLHDQGLLNFDEFALKRVNHGVILGPDGQRMSKSKGNVVNPEEQREKYGADTVRMYLCFIGPHEEGGTCKLEGIEGMSRFLGRVWRLVNEWKDSKKVTDEAERQKVDNKRNLTINKVTSDLENFRFNTPIASIMEYVNFMGDHKSGVTRDSIEALVKLMSPFSPHIAEEIWVEVLGNKYSVHTSKWPKYDTKVYKETENVMVIQVDGKLRSQIVIASVESKNNLHVETLARKDPKVSKWLEGRKIQNVIFVPGRLINFVTG